LNGINVDKIKEDGNRSLELWEIYKEQFPHFKTTYDEDDDDIKTLYSYPTPTELRYLVLRAEKVIKSILDGDDLETFSNIDKTHVYGEESGAFTEGKNTSLKSKQLPISTNQKTTTSVEETKSNLLLSI
jgi:hypothetical protein